MKEYTFLFRLKVSEPFGYYSLNLLAPNPDEAHVRFNDVFHHLTLTEKLENNTFSIMAETSCYHDLTVNFSKLCIEPFVSAKV